MTDVPRADPAIGVAGLEHLEHLGELEQAALALVGRPVLSVGIDHADIDELRSTMRRQPRFAERVFTGAERSYCEQRPDPAERFAARFAAKEATLKALAVGIEGARFTDIEILRRPSGQPYLRLSGRALARSRAAGVGGWLISLTHGRQVASAMVVALAGPASDRPTAGP